ncbi:MAG: hypothetical protein Q8P86_03960 [bacterium]|nr:hypothetical protein [bacterium]
MIDLETKEKLLKEIEKSGNVYLSCMKTGIDKATFYRWKKDDKQFNKKATEAIKRGRENNCELAEHALMLNVKEKKMDAIKYVLSHQSKIYRPKDRKVFLVHSNTKTSDKAISAKKKEDIRSYTTGYTDAMKEFMENERDVYEKEKHPSTEEEVVDRLEDVRSGKAEVPDDNLMEEAKRHYAKRNGEVLDDEEKTVKQNLPPPKDEAESGGQVVNKIVLDLPGDDDE